MSRWMEIMRLSLAGSAGIRLGMWFTAAMLGASLVALPFDRRTILGISPWIKPIKFELSILIFLATCAVLLWALGTDGRWAGQRSWIGWGFGVSMMVEIAVIVLQSARGARSHMNFDTPLDTGLFAAMGIFILLNTVLSGWLLALWCGTTAGLAPAVAGVSRLGLVVLLLGSIEGVRMVGNGGHTVGAADGGAGLPFVNWSTRYGDLRVAHFFALHALQIFPLVGIALASTRLRTDVQTAGIFTFAAVYLGAVCWLFAEAMRGIPVVRL